LQLDFFQNNLESEFENKEKKIAESIKNSKEKYRKKQFRGMMSYVLGQLFEDWLEQILVDGYEIEDMLENVDTVQHSSYEDKGKPDFVLKHNDGSYTILAAKCYASPRSETLEKDEV